MKKYIYDLNHNPYRIFFLLGTLFLFWGAVLWVPMTWGNNSSYPIHLHRYLMLNGFIASFIAGFLMTAVPKFSQTESSKFYEIITFGFMTILGLIFAMLKNEEVVFVCSSLQAAILLFFMISRITKRKANPPFSFVFVFVGLFLWLISGLLSAFTMLDIFKRLHYEGAIAAIIMGVGSRLIPGILGHSDIIMKQNTEVKIKPLYSIVPISYYFIIFSFILSYLLPTPWGEYLRGIVVFFVAVNYWQIFSRPKDKTALTQCLWICSWMIAFSFILRAFWPTGYIHASHMFFISGVVLICLLIATRVLQAHGPKDKNIENKKVLYLITFLIIFSGLTRIVAYLIPHMYMSHLGYSALTLDIAVGIWAYHFLRYIRS